MNLKDFYEERKNHFLANFSSSNKSKQKIVKDKSQKKLDKYLNLYNLKNLEEGEDFKEEWAETS